MDLEIMNGDPIKRKSLRGKEIGLHAIQGPIEPSGHGKKKQFLGRSGNSWVGLLIFYVLFYSGLIGFFALNYFLFSKTLDDHTPTYSLDGGVLGTNPGVSFKPTGGPNDDDGYLINVHVGNDTANSVWYKQLQAEINGTQVPQGSTTSCNHHGFSSTPSLPCRVDTSKFENCTQKNSFGYNDGKPCVLIKLNRMYNWRPQPYGVKDGKYDRDLLVQDLNNTTEHEEMPTEVKNMILDQVKKNFGNEVNILNNVWISCAGQTAQDVARLPTPRIHYYPLVPAIPGYHFPFLNQPFYQNPFIMVQLDVPPTSRHVRIDLECKAWAKNIHHVKEIDGVGFIRFAVHVDSF